MFGQSSWLVLHPKTKTFQDYKQEISNLETNLMEQFPQSLFYEFGSGAPCWFSVCQRMIDQEHRGTGTEEQIKSLSQVSVGGGRTLGAAQTGKKAPPLAQSHTNPLPSVSLPPLPTCYYHLSMMMMMPVFHHHLLLLILQSSPIPSWLPWMVGTPRYKKTNDDDDDYDNFEEKWWWWKW